jgi:chromosome segregation ATPase
MEPHESSIERSDIDPPSEVDGDQNDIEGILLAVHSLMNQLNCLKGVLRHLEADRRAASENMAELRWQLRKAEQENVHLREHIRRAPVDVSAYDEARKEIAMLQCEVEMYQYSRSVSTTASKARSWWKFWRR